MVNELSPTVSRVSSLDDVSTPSSIRKEIRRLSSTRSVEHPDNGVTPHLHEQSSDPILTPLPTVSSSRANSP